MNLKQSVMKLTDDIQLFSMYWTEADLSTLQIPYHTTPLVELAEGRGSMDIAFINVNDTLERAIVSIIKKYVYRCEEWEDSYANDTTEMEWYEYLKSHWIPTYFSKPVFDKYMLKKELDELQYNYNSLENSQEINNAYKRLIDIVKKSEIVHFNDESFRMNYFLAYNKKTLCLYFWWLNC